MKKKLTALLIAVIMLFATVATITAQNGNSQGGNGNQNCQGEDYCNDDYIPVVTLPYPLPIGEPFDPEPE